MFMGMFMGGMYMFMFMDMFMWPWLAPPHWLLPVAVQLIPSAGSCAAPMLLPTAKGWGGMLGHPKVGHVVELPKPSPAWSAVLAAAAGMLRRLVHARTARKGTRCKDTWQRGVVAGM
jgi:hypothetical protein